MTTPITPEPGIAASASLQDPAGRSALRASAGLRLRRREPSAADGFVDGGWWPRSLDLSVELPALLSELGAAGHDVARVAYNPSAWNPAPHALAGAGRPVVLEARADQDTAALSLADISGAKRTELVVIPPHTAPQVARRVLALARLGGDLHRAVGILERASAAVKAGTPDIAPPGPEAEAVGRTFTSSAPSERITEPTQPKS
jgi:hypothetical protein